MVLDIFGDETLKCCGIEGVVGDGEPTIVEQNEPLPPNFFLDLSSIPKEQPGSSLVEPPVTGFKNQSFDYFPNNKDTYGSFLK